MSFEDDLDYLAPKGTIRFTLNGVHLPKTNPKPVVLVIRHTETTASYVAARAARDSNRTAGLAGAQTTPEQDREYALGVAALFATHIVERWEDALDATGQPLPLAKVGEMFAALIRLERSGIFGEVVSAARNPSNFAKAPTPNPELLGKE